MRLIDAFREYGLYVGSVVLTKFHGQHTAEAFQRKLETMGVRVYRHYPIDDYPSNIPLIVKAMAELRGDEENEVAENLRKNFASLFRVEP